MEQYEGVSKTWCFTLNNYTAEEEQGIKLWDCKYIIFGHEVGETGTPHLQGYVIFTRAYRLRQLKTFCPRAHFEPAKASEQASNYCTKGTDIYLKDNRIQGKRNDIGDCIKDIQEAGGLTKDVILSHPTTFVKFHKGLRELTAELFTTAPPRSPPRVYWLYGETGTGKTRYVYDQDPNLWCSTGDLKWFDGYKGHYTVLIDDFRSDFCPFPYLLRLLDRYPIQVPVKGGFTWWKPVEIYITAPYSPQQMYVSHPEDCEQLIRRLTGGIHHVTSYEEITIPDPIN